MKVLWITNSPFPEVFEKFNVEVPVNVGWVHSSAVALLNYHEDVKLAVASFYRTSKLKKIDIGAVTHFLLPERLKPGLKNTSDSLVSVWKNIKNDFKPDLTHIHGSEYPHSLSYVQACGAQNVVVSIQGLVSVYERHYYGGIDKKTLKKSTTIRDIIRRDTLFSQQKNMFLRGKKETELLQSVSHIIGRTSWDRAHAWAINPRGEYHFCNETLRSAFYKQTWDPDVCEKHSIFLSQAHYPIKGIHQVIKALPIILTHFPDTKVYVAGHDFFSKRGYKLQGFGKYINSLIKKFDLSKKVVFTGLLSEEEMCQRFVNSNIFVCPSAIENSPNSVGEAQITGVPTITSYVGGTSDMIDHGKDGFLYRFEEYDMLAYHVCCIFSDSELAKSISDRGKLRATARHDKMANAKRLHEIYSTIIN